MSKRLKSFRYVSRFINSGQELTPCHISSLKRVIESAFARAASSNTAVVMIARQQPPLKFTKVSFSKHFPAFICSTPLPQIVSSSIKIVVKIGVAPFACHDDFHSDSPPRFLPHPRACREVHPPHHEDSKNYPENYLTILRSAWPSSKAPKRQFQAFLPRSCQFILQVTWLPY
jgi:hypothetical protein